MGSHQAVRRLLALALVLAACGSSSNSALAEGLGDSLEALADLGAFEFEMSATEALCWGVELADEIGADRWEELGVADPDYAFPGDTPQTDEDTRGIFVALQRCVPSDEVLRRMVVNFQPAFTTQQLDCIVAGLTDVGIGPIQLSNLRQAELTEQQQADEAAATAIDALCASGP